MGEEEKTQEFHLKNGSPLSESSCRAGIGMYIHPLGTSRKNHADSVAIPSVGHPYASWLSVMQHGEEKPFHA